MSSEPSIGDLFSTSEYSTDSFRTNVIPISDIVHRLNQTNQRKKIADRNAILLLNRISLLQKEAERASRRVSTTRAKTLEVLHVKNERVKTAQEKASRQAQRAVDRQRILENNLRREREIKLTVTYKHDLVESHRREIVHKVKDETKAICERVAQAQAEEVQRKRRSRDEVRRQEAETKERKRRELQDRIRKTHEIHLQKLAREEAEAARAEALVQSLAAQEREQMQRLRDAQKEQAEVLNRLEHLFIADSENVPTESEFK